MGKRTFSKEDKLQILKEGGENGVTQTLNKYGIYPATYYSWRKKFEEMGEEGFRHGITAKRLREIKSLEKENRKLKELLAEKELKIRALEEARRKKH